jgi:hypothetical protein
MRDQREYWRAVGWHTWSDVMPPRKAGDDVTARALLAWLRINKFAATSVTVGNVTIDGLVDLGLAMGDPRAPTREDAASLLATYGGPALKRALGDDAITEDDDEPALGRRHR